MTDVTLTPFDVGISLDFMRRTAPELARDIVIGLEGAAKLAESYGLNEFQWAVLKRWPAFVQLTVNAREELGGNAGTMERARRQAALAVAEFTVTDMVAIMGDGKAQHKDRIGAAEVLMEIGGFKARQTAAAAVPGAAAQYGGGSLIQYVMPEKPKNITEAPVDAAAAAVAELERQKTEKVA
jgi:hypothetical protein